MCKGYLTIPHTTQWSKIVRIGKKFYNDNPKMIIRKYCRCKKPFGCSVKTNQADSSLTLLSLPNRIVLLLIVGSGTNTPKWHQQNTVQAINNTYAYSTLELLTHLRTPSTWPLLSIFHLVQQPSLHLNLNLLHLLHLYLLHLRLTPVRLQHPLQLLLLLHPHLITSWRCPRSNTLYCYSRRTIDI